MRKWLENLHQEAEDKIKAAPIQEPPIPAKDGPEVCPVAGQVVRLYHMRPACQEAGHCLALTVELGCNLYPVRPGWCRERV